MIELGESLGPLDSYLEQLNPLVPSHRATTCGCSAKVSDGVSRRRCRIWPRLLGNRWSPGDTVVDKQRQLRRCSMTWRGSPTPPGTSLQANGDNIIRLRPGLPPPLDAWPATRRSTRASAGSGELRSHRCPEAYRDYTLHIILETIPNQPPATGRRTTRSTGRTTVPHCETSAQPGRTPRRTSAPQPAPDEVKDGVEYVARQVPRCTRLRPELRPDVGLVRHRG